MSDSFQEGVKQDFILIMGALARQRDTLRDLSANQRSQGDELRSQGDAIRRLEETNKRMQANSEKMAGDYQSLEETTETMMTSMSDLTHKLVHTSQPVDDARFTAIERRLDALEQRND